MFMIWCHCFSDFRYRAMFWSVPVFTSVVRLSPDVFNICSYIKTSSALWLMHEMRAMPVFTSVVRLSPDVFNICSYIKTSSALSCAPAEAAWLIDRLILWASSSSSCYFRVLLAAPEVFAQRLRLKFWSVQLRAWCSTIVVCHCSWVQVECS